MDTINTIISFTILATFPTVANLIIVATLTAQPILANLLILSTNSSLYTITILLFVTIYRLASLSALANLDIPNILVILDSLSGLTTHATPDKIAVLVTHSSLDIINTIISLLYLLHFLQLLS